MKFIAVIVFAVMLWSLAESSAARVQITVRNTPRIVTDNVVPARVFKRFMDDGLIEPYGACLPPGAPCNPNDPSLLLVPSSSCYNCCNYNAEQYDVDAAICA